MYSAKIYINYILINDTAYETTMMTSETYKNENVSDENEK